MTETEAIKKLIEVHKSQIGYTCENLKSKYAEEIDSHMDDWQWYNGRKYGFDYCTVYYDWCMIKAFGVEIARKILNRPKNSLGAGVRYSRQYLKNLGRVGNEPKVGCAVYFGSLPYPRHIGFVYKVTDKMIYTYEGNCYVSKNVTGVKARSYSRTDSDILDYGYPLYTSAPEPDPKELNGFKVGNTYEVVCNDPLMIRKGPGTGYAKIGALSKGDRIDCIGLRLDTDDNTWLQFDRGWSCGIYDGTRYMDDPGVIVNGWIKRDGKWYYYENGQMVQNDWELYKGDLYYLGGDGAMLTGWQKIGDETYYFYSDGHMARAEWIDGLYISQDGVQAYKNKGKWKQNNKGQWYEDESGWYPKDRSVRIDGVDYDFDSMGYLIEH